MMKNFMTAMLVASVSATALGGVVMAQETAKPVLKLCTGVEGGNYEFAANKLRNQLKKQIDVQFVPTDGAVDNLTFVKNGTCDAALTQSDVVWQGNGSDVFTLSRMYTEYGHLVCNRKSGINDFGDLVDKTIQIYAGVSGGGAEATLRGLIKADKENGGNDYDGISVVAEDNEVALTDIGEGNGVPCLFYVGAPGNRIIAEEAEKRAETLVLVPIVDKDFDDVTYKDKSGKSQSVWNRVTLDGDAYGNIMPSGTLWGNSSLETVGVTSQFIVSGTWRNENNKAYGKLGGAIIDVKKAVAAERGLKLVE